VDHGRGEKVTRKKPDDQKQSDAGRRVSFSK